MHNSNRAEDLVKQRTELRQQMDRNMAKAIPNAGSAKDLNAELTRGLANAKALRNRAQAKVKGLSH